MQSPPQKSNETKNAHEIASIIIIVGIAAFAISFKPLNFIGHIYTLLAASFIILYFLYFLQQKISLPLLLPSPLKALQMITLCIIFLTLGTHIETALKQLASVQKNFAKQSLHQKNLRAHGLPYLFAQFCRSRVSGRYQAVLITDLDIKAKIPRVIHRILRYSLYPEINIWLHDGSNINCLIIFNKMNPKQSVPDNFKIIGEFDDYSLIAIKKKI